MSSLKFSAFLLVFFSSTFLVLASQPAMANSLTCRIEKKGAGRRVTAEASISTVKPYSIVSGRFMFENVTKETYTGYIPAVQNSVVTASIFSAKVVGVIQVNAKLTLVHTDATTSIVVLKRVPCSPPTL